MTKVVVAREAGACYGVERALKLALRACEGATGPVHTLGPLIHNPSVVRELESRGVSVVEDASCVEGGSTLLLRTHGVTPEVEDRAREAGARVIDATCPYVKKCHVAAERLSQAGYQVIIVGEQGHPEVEGTLGHAPQALVIGSAEELGGVELARRVGVVVQTTQSRANLRLIVGALVGRVEELRLVDTICEATSGNQGAAAALAATVDVMIVIGGRNSANTTRLAEISAAVCPRTHHIELEGELKAAWFDGAETVGVTAGASTPQAQIEAVTAAIEALVGA